MIKKDDWIMCQMPKKRNQISNTDLMIISVLCSICSAVRIIFHYIPYITPFTALIIIIGSYLGSYYGFSVGALSIFVSNFVLGQGLWTLFQMIAISIIGYLSGIFFKNSRRKNVSRTLLWIWGIFSVNVIYGGILSFYEFIFVYNKIFDPFQFFTIYLKSTLVGGIWHAISTIFCLAFFFNSIGKVLINSKFNKNN
jgi:energy-coupling factor transport system ATP-binding protein